MTRATKSKKYKAYNRETGRIEWWCQEVVYEANGVTARSRREWWQPIVECELGDDQ